MSHFNRAGARCIIFGNRIWKLLLQCMNLFLNAGWNCFGADRFSFMFWTLHIDRVHINLVFVCTFIERDLQTLSDHH